MNKGFDTSKNNLHWGIGLSILFIIGAFAYTFYANTRARIDRVQTQVVELVSVSQSRKIDDPQVDTATVRSAMTAKKTNAEINNNFNAFLAEWKKAPLSEGQAKNYTDKFNTLYNAQKDKFTNETWNQFLAMGIISVLVVAFLLLSFITTLLRDLTGNPAPRNVETGFRMTMLNNTNNPDDYSVLPPYSLSRTQLALWITIIGSVYTYAIFWDHIDLQFSETALLLMGISGGTFAAGVIIDTMEINQGIARHQDYYTKSNFFKDILSDQNGISIHRFQNLVWTVIAIFTYFYKYSNPPGGKLTSLPVLDSTLLALTGISSATYLVLKTRENVSQKKPVDVKIQLVIEDIPLKTLIEASADGLKKALIRIIDNNTEIAHAMPDPADPKFNFLATVEPGKLYKIEASWEDKEGQPKIKLSGSTEETIDAAKTITITMKKTA